MKRKQNAREERSARKAALKLRASQVQAKPKPPAQPAASLALHTLPAAGKKKPRNKAAGLKSALAAGNKIYLTSFGRGNAANLEQMILPDEQFAVKPLTAERTLEIRAADQINMAFSGNRIAGQPDVLTADNPLHRAGEHAGADNLGLKLKLEKRYFGQNFDDNIHIQIIYQILDLEKILAVYTTNAAAAISHLCDVREPDSVDAEEEDMIGYLSSKNTYETFKNPEMTLTEQKTIENIRKTDAIMEDLFQSRRLGYFGLELLPIPEYTEDMTNEQKQAEREKTEKQSEPIKKRLYHLLCLIGELRQWCFHGKSQITATWLYNLESRLEAEYLKTMDYYFSKAVRKITDVHPAAEDAGNADETDTKKTFPEKNKVNLLIMLEEFPQADPLKLTEQYYDFMIRKSQRNLGFSIKKLREAMLQMPAASALNKEDLIANRQYLYVLLDFTLYRHYQAHPEQTDALVAALRSTMTEQDKQSVYACEAENIWKLYSLPFLNFSRSVSWEERTVYREKKLPEAVFGFIMPDDYGNISAFSKLIFALCIFLDGKEINELLTALLSKFDNIASLMKCAGEIGIPIEFSEDYVFFRDAGRYVREMDLVRNISRMTKPKKKSGENRIKRVMFRDALDILGIPSGTDEETLNQQIDIWLKRTEDGRKVPHDFRNFIVNNVLKNRRFLYLIRFCNPRTARGIAENKAVTSFVLRQMPREQITSYYLSCFQGISEGDSYETKIRRISEMIAEMNFGTFEDVETDNDAPERKQDEKTRYMAIVRLYLTVIYLAVKNLVNINARYVMAFHCLERDTKLYDPKNKKKNLELIEYLLQNDLGNRYLTGKKNYREHIDMNLKYAKQHLNYQEQNGKWNGLKKHRNYVAHLTYIRKCDQYMKEIREISSYYALYQYIVQNAMAQNMGIAPETEGMEEAYPYYAKLFRYRTYVKDFVKTLNFQFGYNKPRYNSLTIETLFDKNELSRV